MKPPTEREWELRDHLEHIDQALRALSLFEDVAGMLGEAGDSCTALSDRGGACLSAAAFNARKELEKTHEWLEDERLRPLRVAVSDIAARNGGGAS